MKYLVIGKDGLLGGNLMKALQVIGVDEVMGTTRREGGDIHLDLSKHIPILPEADVVYLCAAIKGFEPCEGKANSWVANVDAPLAIALQMKKLYGTFPVFISSDAVEWSPSSYARQKANVELGILMMDGAVVRPGRFDKSNIDGLVMLTATVGIQKLSGVHKWSA